MSQVNVTISGKTYRMACAEGEEAHLEALAAGFDARITDMRAAFGEIGDMRLHVMAALTLADELAELRERLDSRDTELASLRAQVHSAEADRESSQRDVTEAIESAARRVEAMARRLAGQPSS